jgi:predicted nucleotide-binding protein
LLIGVETTVLGRVLNKGRTIIEKFDDTARQADLGVVVATAGDVGAARRTPKKARRKYQTRARQNVILECGYFMGRLGRKGVILLYEEGVDLPSDILGLGYIPLDSGGEWKKKLLEEVSEALGLTTSAVKQP